MNRIYHQIYRKIKKYQTIVIVRHVGADPDGLGSQIALRDLILNTFPKKKVYAVGYPASKFKYLGILDRFDESMYEDSLLIVLDTPNKSRVDGVDVSFFQDSIKIDHHPFIEQFCNLEWIDPKASSASQMIIELVFHTRLRMTKEAAEKLYIGLVADTNRFLFQYTTAKTFSLVGKLVETTNIDFTSLYEELYLRPMKEIRFEGYVANHFTITENGLAYIKITSDILNEHNVDAATAGNLINNFNFIEEILTWVVFSVDQTNEIIRCNIRSRGPVINTIAESFGGGGHALASGVRLKSEEDIMKLITLLDENCKNYKEIHEE